MATSVPSLWSVRASIPTAVRDVQLPLWLNSREHSSGQGMVPGHPLLQAESPCPPPSVHIHTNTCLRWKLPRMCWQILFQTIIGSCPFPSYLGNPLCWAPLYSNASLHANTQIMKETLGEKKTKNHLFNTFISILNSHTHTHDLRKLCGGWKLGILS